MVYAHVRNQLFCRDMLEKPYHLIRCPGTYGYVTAKRMAPAAAIGR